MRVFADLQLHSRYAMATSKDMDLEHLAAGARMKGLGLLATGDFTHPKWFEELKAKLVPIEGTGLYSLDGMTFMLAGEVSTVYQQEGRTRKVHHLLYAEDFEAVSQLNTSLSRFGNLGSDGRPVLTGIDSAELAEIVFEVSPRNVLIPAHAWTPWFSVFGSKSGFDTIEECYKDQSGRIFAIETGLSSDPAMNWRISSLDRFALVSNSDAHSANPWRLGREANAFDLQKLAYSEVFSAIRLKDPARFLFTVEVDPAYGKYHYTGHKKCGTSLPPAEAASRGNKCPVCGKPMTMGVMQRVEELADREEGYTPAGAIPFKSLMPLYEVISAATGTNRLYAKKVIDEQDRLIKAHGNEFAVLLEASVEELERTTSPSVAQAIISAREGRLKVTPGYDGVYGRAQLT